ncbi:hypothetical protein Bbelb_248030 [Branchiostoma belcheri]|nr:hypothetical protein Bbelb_248030 [Branchiostoma belcheri]
MASEFLQPGRPLMAEDGTAALNRFWLNLNSKDGLDQDKPDRPAEMPEILTFIVGSRSWSLPSKLLVVRLSLHSRKEGSKLRRRLQDQMRFIFLPGKCNDASLPRQPAALAISTRPLIAEDGTAAHHAFWLNLNWKDARLYGGTHSFNILHEDD